MPKKKKTMKKQIIAVALLATVPFATVSASETYGETTTAPVQQESILDKIKKSVTKRTSAISIETDLEIGLTSYGWDNREDASNYRPEIAAGAKVKFGNLATLVVSAIQEDTLDVAGDTTFDQDHIDMIVKDLHMAFSIGAADLKVGNMGAIGNVGVASNDARSRDALSDQTRQEFESVTGVQIALNKTVLTLPAPEQEALAAVVGLANQALAHTRVTAFNNSGDLLDFSDIDSYAVETFVSLKGITVSGATIQAKNDAGDDKRYIVGATKAIKGVDVYAKREMHDNDASDVDTRTILGLGKAMTGDTQFVPSVVDSLLAGTYVSAEYQEEKMNDGSKTDIWSTNIAKDMGNGLTLSGQVAYEDDADDEVTVKAKASFKF